MRPLCVGRPTSGPALRSQRGQAVTEYLLILVVTVGIALGILYQLNTAFKKYVQNYFGEYIACLLETGEMPSLSAGDGANAEICNASFEPFSMKAGRPLIASGDGKGGNAIKRSSKSSSSGSGPNSNNSKLTRNNSALNGERLNNGGTVAASTDAKGNKISARASDINSGTFKFRTARMSGDEQIRLDSKFVMGMDKDKEDSSPMIKQLDAKNPNTQVNRKLAFTMDAFRKKDIPPDTNLNLSAGDWLRYLLIFAILIGILVFFGGQINQLRKSWEK